MKANPVLRVDEPLGIDTAWRSPPGTALNIVDMRSDSRGGWRSVGGFAPLKKGETWAGYGTAWSITWFNRHNGASRFLVYEFPLPDGSLRLSWHRMQDGTSKTIESGRTLVDGCWQRTQFAANRGWLYFLNGHNTPQRWNGTARVRVGFSSPAAAPGATDETASLADAQGYYDMAAKNPASGVANYRMKGRQRGVGVYADTVAQRFVYGYRVTWVNDLGMESEPSDIVFIKGSNSTGAEGVKTVVIGTKAAPYNVIATRLYRTVNLFETAGTVTSSEFTVYFHSEHLSGISLVIADERSDDELGLPLNRDSLGSFPSGAKYLAFFKGTMFVAGMPDGPDRVRYSAPLFVEQFPDINFLEVGASDAGEVRGMKATKNALVVFKERGVFLVKGDQSRGFFIETLTEDVGNSAPNALVEIPGLGMMFVGSDGVYVLEGALENTGTPTRVVDISLPLRGLWEHRISTQQLINAHATVYHRERCVWLQLPADGDWRPSLGLVYHYDKGQWSTRESWPMSCAVESQDEYGWLWFGSFDPTHPGVHVYSPGYVDKDGTAIASTYRTSWIDFGSVYERADVLYAHAHTWDYGGTRQLGIRVYRDRGLTVEHNTTRDLSDHEVQREVWGTATWGTSIWEDHIPVPVRFDMSDIDGSLGILAQEFSMELYGERFTLTGYDLEVAPRGGATNIQQLSNAIAPVKR